MAISQLCDVLQHLRGASLQANGAEPSDGQLLEIFLSSPASEIRQAAFALLVRRHGRMVWSVCRRVLNNHHLAEDAFQAVFMVLVRRASAVSPRNMLANWLYGVAHQTALKARALAARRRGRERQVASMPEPASADRDPRDRWTDLQPLLDEELSRLPDKYRAVIVLCDLEGKTRQEAARQLGVPPGTVAGRLARARVLLAKRLGRRGLALAGGSLGALLAQHGAAFAVPPQLVSSTLKAMNLLAAGQAAASAASLLAAALTEGVLKAMLMKKLKGMAVSLLLLGLAACGGGFLHHALADDSAAEVDRPNAARPADQAREQDPVRNANQQRPGAVASGRLEAVDPDKGTVTIAIPDRTTGTAASTKFEVAKDAVITQDGKPVKLADLKIGQRATAGLTADRKTVLTITVVGNPAQGVLKSIDAEKGTITLTMETRNGKMDRTFKLAKDAKVTLDNKDAKLADLKVGATVFLTLSVSEENTAVQVRVGGGRTRPSNE